MASFMNDSQFPSGIQTMMTGYFLKSETNDMVTDTPLFIIPLITFAYLYFKALCTTEDKWYVKV